jgi:tetratricopeptide (TPR) repeat protein
VVRRAVTLLAAQGRAGAADRLVSQAQARGALGGDFLRQAAEIAARARNFDHAVELARQAVPGDAGLYRDQLGLGQVLAACGRDAEAAAAFRRAARQVPDSPEVWLTLLTHLNRTGEVDQADAAVAEMKERLPAALRALTLARVQEALGRFGRAEAEYHRARTERPHEALVLRRLADFYLRLDRPARAEEVLRSLLGPRAALPLEEVPAVRRQLALALSADGRGGAAEALKLLEENRASGASEESADRLTLLLVKAQQPGGRAAALRALGPLLKGPPLPAEEQLRLARLYEAEGDWARARECLLGLVARDGQNPAYLAALAEGLLKRGRRAEARPWLERLAQVEPDAPRTRGLRRLLVAPGVRD